MNLLKNWRLMRAKNELVRRGFCSRCFKQKAERNFVPSGGRGGWVSPVCGICWAVRTTLDEAETKRLFKMVNG